MNRGTHTLNYFQRARPKSLNGIGTHREERLSYAVWRWTKKGDYIMLNLQEGNRLKFIPLVAKVLLISSGLGFYTRKTTTFAIIEMHGFSDTETEQDKHKPYHLPTKKSDIGTKEKLFQHFFFFLQWLGEPTAIMCMNNKIDFKLPVNKPQPKWKTEVLIWTHKGARLVLISRVKYSTQEDLGSDWTGFIL